MILRAVLAVLTLVGAVPFRVCTCGAAHHHHLLPHEADDHDSSPNGPAADAAGHDHECPAARPRAAMSVGVAAAVADVGTDCPPVLAIPTRDVSPVPLATGPERRSPDPPPPTRPLFLTLGTFRN